MPPAYEILLLNTAIPQIQAAQSGDTYLVPRDIAFSTVANLANGTNLLPSLTFSSDTNTGIYREGADALGFTAGGGTNQMVLTSTGLGIGTSSPTEKLTVAGNIKLGTSGTTYVYGPATNGRSFISNSDSTAYIGIYGSAYGAGSNSIISFVAGTTNIMTFDASGNLGLGVTPSGWSSSFYKAIEGGDANSQGAIAFNLSGTSNGVDLWSNGYFDGTNSIYKYSATAGLYQVAGNVHRWYNAPSGTADGTAATSLTSAQNGNSYTIKVAGTTDFTLIGAANNNVGTTFTKSGGTGAGTGTVSQNISFTQAMTLDASGNLGIQYTSPGTMNSSNGSGVLVVGSGTGSNGMTIFSGSTNTSRITFADSATGAGSYDGQIAYDHNGQAIQLINQNQEKARITSGGYFKASNNGTYNGAANLYHEFYNTANDEFDVWCQHASATTPKGIRVYYSAAAPNGTGNHFLYCDDTGGQRASIRSNGGLANYQSNNVDLSDIRTKTDINPLASYWGKIAALEIVTYKYKDQTHDDLNIGVIAQQVEQVAPEFVDADGFGETPEDGVPLKTIYNKDLTFAAIKALQEAMARIEKLEAEVAALKGA